MKWWVFAAAAVIAVGCGAGVVTESDSQRVRDQFSQEAYEKAMIEAGRGDELEAQKQREAAFLAGTGEQDAGQR